MRQTTNDASDISLQSTGYVPGPPIATYPHCMRQIFAVILAAHIAMPTVIKSFPVVTN